MLPAMWWRETSRKGSFIAFDVSTVLLLWAVGGLWFVWLTARYDYVSSGYRWLGYVTWLGLAALGSGLGLAGGGVPLRDIAGLAMVGVALLGLVAGWPAVTRKLPQLRHLQQLVLLAPLVGVVALVAAGIDAGSEWNISPAVAVLRVLVGGLFLGAVTSTMLLGHWYLVQPGMSRQPLLELVWWAGGLWLADVVVWLAPRGMLSVLAGAESATSGAAGSSLMGWFWLACAVATAGLLLVTRLALKEPRYAAVMAATGLSYLAIMTAFAMELVARAGLFG